MLTFTGLAPIGAAVQSALPGPIFQDSQALGPGTFTLTSTPVAPGPAILLTGNITGAVITGIDGGGSGAVLDAHGITYTGGAIAGALPPGAVVAGNDMSIEMTGVIPTFGINGTTEQLNPFTADATGSFDINATGFPEPGSLTIIGLVGAASLARRRSRR